MSSDDPVSSVDPRSAPGLLSDRQLIEACRLVRWERRLHRFTWSGWGCGASLLAAAGIATLAGYFALRRLPHNTRFWVPVAPAVPLLAAVLFMLLARLAERRRKRYWAELKRRYAGADVREYVARVESEANAHRQAGPDTVVILAGAALPHGGNWLLRVRLWPGETGTVESRKLRPGYLSGIDANQVQTDGGEAILSTEECQRVRQAIADVSCRRTKVFSTAIDGSPASLVVWEQGRGATITADCNLAGVPKEAEGKPAVRLMRLVMELGHKVPAKPLIVGAFHPMANEIRIGGV